jgi:hypothetical protein
MKFRATHNIVVPGPMARLTIPVMESQGDLWQRGEMSRGEPFPVWRLVNGQLKHRHGQLPANTTILTLNAPRPDR